MRRKDLRDYFAWRRIVRNPWAVVRFRKERKRDSTLIVPLRSGQRLYLRGGRRDYRLFRNIFLRDEYHLRQHDGERWQCAIDLGANVGVFSCRVAAMAARVIAYEPVPENVAQLRISIQDFPNIIAVPQAVAGQSGPIRIYHPRAEQSTARFSMFPEDHIHCADAYTVVEAVTLDQIFASHHIETCDMLKMDVEGAEYAILYAASDDVLRRIRRIYGEYHHVTPETQERSIEHLSEFLRQKGFRVEVIRRKRRSNHGPFFAKRMNY